MEKKKPLNAPLASSLEARKVAALGLEQVLITKRPLDVFFTRDPAFLALEDQDRAFCQRIIRSTLRHYGELEASFHPYFNRPLGRDKYRVLAHLYLAGAQIAYEHIPPYAAINSAVEIAKMYHRNFSGMLNAMLRRWMNDYGEGLPAQPQLNVPAWLHEKWLGHYGGALTDILMGLTAEPPVDLSFKTKAARQQLLDALGDEAELIGETVRIYKHMAVSELPGFAQGQWWVQDVAASLPVCLLGDIAGKQVLDMCAAPGGKTMQLLARGARVTALDHQDKRLDVVRENIARVFPEIADAAEMLQLHAADALQWQSDALFDAVLLDAPCSSTGTLRRNPDVKYIRSPKNLLDTVGKQKKLLQKAAEHLKVGGVLVYCVCSMEPEEAEEVIEQFLSANSAMKLANNEQNLPIPVLDSGGLGLRTHSGMQPVMDGFFMTCMVRQS